MGHCGGESEQNRLPDCAPNRDDKCSHHRLGVPRFECVQGAKEKRRWNKDQQRDGAALEALNEVGHGTELFEVAPDDFD